MKSARELGKHKPTLQVLAVNGKRNGDPELARKLLELRHSHHLTHRQVAAETGLSYPYLSQLEHARSMPSVEKLARLAAFYETTLDALAGHMVEAANSEQEAKL